MNIPNADVKQLEIKFNIAKLFTEYKNISDKFPKHPQINVIAHDDAMGLEQFTFGSGSLYDKQTNKHTIEYNKFNNLIEYYKNTYTDEVYHKVKEYLGSSYKIGRVRWMTLLPKSALSYHIDEFNTFRLHIPIQTTSNAFFIVDDVVWRMDSAGYLYYLNTQKKHTAVNTDNNKRVHLLFDVWHDVD